MRSLRLWLVAAALALLVGACGCGLHRGHRDAALRQAVLAGDRDKAERLLRAGADPNGVIRTPAGRGIGFSLPLYSEKTLLAHSLGNLALARLLLEHGADPNAGDPPPLHRLGRQGGGVAVGQLLLDHGADPDGRESQTPQRTPLMAAAGAASTNRPLVALLIQRGADLNARDSAGRTALHTSWHAEVTLLLLQCGADVNALDNEGHSPYDYRCLQRDVGPLLWAWGGRPHSPLPRYQGPGS